MTTTATIDAPAFSIGLGQGINDYISAVTGCIDLAATSGLDTDADGRVLDSNFKPIKGLYAAGNNTGGRFITIYQSPIAGVSMGMAITEGFIPLVFLSFLMIRTITPQEVQYGQAKKYHSSARSQTGCFNRCGLLTENCPKPSEPYYTFSETFSYGPDMLEYRGVMKS